MSMSKFGKRLAEHGPVTIRRNESEDNLEYDITDYHGHRYPAANKDELRELRAAINDVLGDSDER